MHIPRRDQRTREDIIEYIKKCAQQYVPEWQFDPENPDAGTALAALFADMMYDNIKRFNLSAVGDMFSFFDEVHGKLLPAKPAEGFITFSVPEGMEGQEEIPKGAKLLAQGEQEPLVFETVEDTLVGAAGLRYIYLSNPKEDAVYQAFDREQQEPPSFFLFQKKGRNMQRHRLCFCFSHGLDIRNLAQAELSFQIAGEDARRQEWEWAVQEGKGICFSYGTEDGYQQLECECEEGKIRFEIAGAEHKIATEQECLSKYTIQAQVTDAELFSRLCFSKVSLSVRSQNIRPDFIHVNGTDEELEDFLVFGSSPSVYDEFYIGSQEVFGKAGATIRIEFALNFVRISQELASEKKVSWKTVMKKQDFIPEREYDISIQEVVWEYYNGYGWTRLPEGSKYKHFFGTEEGQGERTALLEFICPSDICKVLVNSTETYAVRARITRMNNANKTPGAYAAPVAGRVSLSYDYSGAPLVPDKIIRWNNLDSQEISGEELGQEGFFTAFCDIGQEQHSSCYLGFEHPVAGSPRNLLFVMQDTLQQAIPGVRWEYYGEGGFKPLHPIDGTRGFQQTGIVSWSEHKDIQKKKLFGQTLFWIRLTDTKDAYQNNSRGGHCPKIQGIYPNAARIAGIHTQEGVFSIPPFAEEKNVKLPVLDLVGIKVWVQERIGFRQDGMQPVWKQWEETKELGLQSGRERKFAVDRQKGIVMFPKYMDASCLNEQGEIAVRIWYQHCQGERGNLPAGKINQMDVCVGAVSGCYNPTPTAGGASHEKALTAVNRNAQILRHGARCVTAKDYEDMAWDAAGDLCKVKCFSGYDSRGIKCPGAVTLAVLPKEYQERADHFEKTKSRIQDYLTEAMDGTILHRGKFFIVRPDIIRLEVRACVQVFSEDEAFLVRRRILEKLEQFLDPLKGNFYGEGWEIGTLPNQNQILHALERVEGVRQIRQIALRRLCRGWFEESEINEASELPFYVLPGGGSHEIQMEL